MVLGELEQRPRMLWIDGGCDLGEIFECFAHRRGVVDGECHPKRASMLGRRCVTVAGGECCPAE